MWPCPTAWAGAEAGSIGPQSLRVSGASPVPVQRPAQQVVAGGDRGGAPLAKPLRGLGQPPGGLLDPLTVCLARAGSAPPQMLNKVAQSRLSPPPQAWRSPGLCLGKNQHSVAGSQGGLGALFTAAQEECTQGGDRASWLDLEPGVGGEGWVDEGTFTRSAA